MAERTPQLSPREKEIVDLAAGGFTDAGIAHKLEISTPTVGTYWNRIRAKVGPYSRTEIVAMLLMAESQKTIAELRAKYEALLSEVGDSPKSPWKTLFENAPDAMIMVGSDGSIREVNEEAERMFGYGPGELRGMPLHTLVPVDRRLEHIERVKEYIQHPEHKRMADHVGTVALRKDGSEFLVAADLKGFENDGETLVACVLRQVVS